MKRFLLASSVAAAMAVAVVMSVRAAGLPACDPDNGGLKLPQGFCALVAADNLGPARHLTVASNGDVYVSLRTGRGGASPLVALRDADGDGRFEVKEGFGARGGTGIAIRNGYLYVASPTSVDRYKM